MNITGKLIWSPFPFLITFVIIYFLNGVSALYDELLCSDSAA